MKDAHSTAGIGKLHAYLGHFAEPKHINRGHNDLKQDYEKLDEMARERAETPSASERARLQESREKAERVRRAAEADAAGIKTFDRPQVEAPKSRDSNAYDPISWQKLKRKAM